MDGIDPDTLLEWLQTGAGEERDLQLMALEQLCMLLLMSDNIDRCFESCPPRTFLPALGKIFLDETAPENILEVTARAITYYLDVSNECTRRITQVEGAVKAICNRLVMVEMTDRTSKDLAEQCVKLLEHICQREASAVYDAGGLQSMLHLICQHDHNIHKDTMHSAMSVITRLCSKVEPQDANLDKCCSDLGALLTHDDAKISECALRCFAALTDRFIRKSLDPITIATSSNLVEHLLDSLIPTKPSNRCEEMGRDEASSNTHRTASIVNRSPAFISIVLSLLSNLCRGSAAVTDQVIRSSKLVCAVKSVLSSKDERCVMDSLRLADLLVVLLCEGRLSLPKSSASSGEPSTSSGFDRAHRHLIDSIRQRDTDALIDAVENGTIDSNFIDDVGQTLLNWCSAFGTSDMVIYLCDKGADPNKGQRSSSLHYAACFGRADIVKILLQHGANPDIHDEEGRTALDKARERNDEGHQQVVQILESPSSYMLEKLQSKNDNGNSELSETSAHGDTIKEGQVDMLLAMSILQQLVPVFCDIFQNSLVGSVRRSTLALIRKCIYHISNKSLRELLKKDENLQQRYNSDKKDNGRDFVENLMGVLVSVFNNDEDVEGKEQALLVMKSLLEKDAEFWLEQIIRLGVFEKVESLANQLEEIPQEIEKPNSGVEIALPGTLNSQENDGREISIGMDEISSISNSLSIGYEDKSETKTDERSDTSTPSLSIKSDSSLRPNEASQRNSSERLQMLNILSPNAIILDNEPSPPEAIEADHQSTSTTTTTAINIQNRSGREPGTSKNKSNSPFASVKSDLVEAATAVAQALGSRILDDSPSTSPASQKLIFGKRNNSEEAFKLTAGISYKWNDWRLIRTKDTLFLWCDAVAIEFSDGSNGWLRFLMDGKLSTMYSSGSPETGADNPETRAEFIGKIQRAKAGVPSGNLPRTIFSITQPNRKIESGNWQICCPENSLLHITNREGSQQKLLVKEDMPGFIFESSRYEKQIYMAESTLGLDFVTGWAARGGGRRLKFRMETQRQKIHELARELWEEYLKEAKTKPRDVLIELQKSATFIELAVEKILKYEKEGIFDSEFTDTIENLNEVLIKVRETIINERLLSTFEISISEIVSAILTLLNAALNYNSTSLSDCFKGVFSNERDLSLLIRKIVLVLEATEKFPQYVYDMPGGSPFGLQLLTRRIRFRLEQADPENSQQKCFLDRTNRIMKSEPLATVGSLKQYLYSMTEKKWYDYSRDSFAFVQAIQAKKANNECLSFAHETDFDTNGLIWYLGTNGTTISEWSNPAIIRVINARSSDGTKQPYGQPEDIFSRDVNALNCHTTDSIDSNFTIDLGVLIYPTAYTLRHSQGYSRSALRNWFLQGSKDNNVWEILISHTDDTSLEETPGSTATWEISLDRKYQGPYRYLRIAQNGKNSSNITYYLSISGFEVYGDVVDVISTDLKPLEVPPTTYSTTKNKTISAPISSTSSNTKKSSRKNATANSPLVPTTTTAPPPNSSLGNVHYSRPPTAASLRFARKLQKAEKSASSSSTTDTNKGAIKAANTDGNGSSEDEILKQLPGGANNNKLRYLRFRRGSRTQAHLPNVLANNKTATLEESELENEQQTPEKKGSKKEILKEIEVGNRVVPSQNWSWGNQNDGNIGTVIAPPNNGWVDVQWDDGTVNSYRYGHVGKFDVELYENSLTKSGSHRGQRGLRSNSSLQKVNEKLNKSTLLNSALIFSKFDKKRENSTINEESSHIGGGDSMEVKNYNSNSATTNTTMNQKSMSTTNLFDDHQKLNVYSLASTNQAASAESLHHQTPSLENLLARSRIYGDRILEVIGDEQNTPIATPEPRLFGGSEEMFQNVDSTKNMERNVNSTSAAASGITGGSQPSLSTQNSKNFSSNENSLESTIRPSQQQQRQNSAFNPINSFRDNLTLFMEDDENLEEENERKNNENLLNTLKESAEQPTSSSNSISNSIFENPTLHTPTTTSSNNLTITNNIDRPNRLGFNEISDVACIDRFINSDDFYGGLLDAYSDIILSGGEGGEGETGRETGHNDAMDNYVGTALLEEMSENSYNKRRKSEANSSANNKISEDFQVGDSATISLRNPTTEHPFGSNTLKSRQISDIGMGLRLKLGNYADVLRGMMQQVMDSSGIIGNFDNDDLENEIYEEELLGQNIIEENCDSSSLIDDEGIYGSEAPAPPSHHGGGSIPQIASFQSQVDAFVNATAALRRQLSASSTTTSGNSAAGANSSTAANLLDALRAADSSFDGAPTAGQQPNSSSTEPKLSWRQIFLGESSGRPSQDGPKDVRSNSGVRNFKKSSRVWDDDFVLRRQFAALIPAFDPRPGRTNVNQTQEVELDNDEFSPNQLRRGSTRQNSLILPQLPSGYTNASKIRVYLSGPNLSNVQNETIELAENDSTIFFYMQKLLRLAQWGQKTEKSRRIWEPTYTLIYENPLENNRISESVKLSDMKKDEYENILEISDKSVVKQALNVIKLLNEFCNKYDLIVPNDVFYSSKLTQKLTQGLTDSLIVAARSLPLWCDQLVFDYSCLFAVETRQMHLRATAFGTSRAIVWLQNRRDQILEQNRSSNSSISGSNLAGSRREDHYPEYRIGRIKHERIKVHRNEAHLLENAIKVMNFHASRKSVLEIEYYGEEGTGLGPTLEFYALVAAEFQRKSLAMWFCDDGDTFESDLESQELDLGEGTKPPGFYVRRAEGLFPAYLSPNTEECAKVANLFKIFGIFLAKVIQDGRLVDIPLSKVFLKLLLSPEVAKKEIPKLKNVLGLEDLALIYPLKAAFLRAVEDLIERRNKIFVENDLSESEKQEKISKLLLKLENEVECSLEDLGLSFVVNPPSNIFTFNEVELVENGAHLDVTMDNVEEYLEKCVDFYLNVGIREQIMAFRQGFDSVFPLSFLTAFSSEEIQALISGEQCPKWSRDDVIKYTEPKLGYTRDSPGFLHLVDVLVEMTAIERKAFLQFTTGCSSLPPGGLANLHPRLTIVRKVGTGDGSYPSVNTCVHYLKLPEYSSAEILRERLLAATYEKGFHLN